MLADWRVTVAYITEKRSALRKASDASVFHSPGHAAILDLVNEIRTWLETNTRYRLSSAGLDEDGYILPPEVERIMNVLGNIEYHEMISSDLVKDPKDPQLKKEVRLSEKDLLAGGITIVKDT